MSKAFTNEEAGDAPQIVRPRAPLPAGTANYVTARGLRALHAEFAELQAARVRVQAQTGADQRLELAPLLVRTAELEARIASAVVMAAPATDRDVIRFGATVTVRSDDRPERVHRIVGVDEANAARVLGLAAKRSHRFPTTSGFGFRTLTLDGQSGRDAFDSMGAFESRYTETGVWTWPLLVLALACLTGCETYGPIHAQAVRTWSILGSSMG